MASVPKLRRKRKQTHRRVGAASTSLRQAKDLRAPKGKPRKALRSLRQTLRAFIANGKQRIARINERIQGLKGGASKAVEWAKDQIGVTEEPAGSNWGPKVSKWIKFTGYTFPVPWCGCFVCFAVVKKGRAAIPNRNRMGYGPYIIADAKANANGFKAVPFNDAQPGDVLVFWGGQHIGMVRERPSGGSIGTLEGNTSSSNAGSQSNGGCVAARTRSESDVSVVARPAY